MAYGTVNADVIGTSVAGSNLGAGNASIMKNRIINGAMVIDQRNAGASVTATTTAVRTYVLDRWNYQTSTASKYSLQQSSTAPAGFVNSLKVTSLAATSLGSSDYYVIGQPIEGYNMADLNWGSANAKTVTLSFQVYSSLTGTFGGAISNSNVTRSYPFTYSIPVANTWTSISITIAGDTGGSTSWVTTNGIGLRLWMSLGCGSTLSGTAGSWAGADYRSATGATSVVGTNGATFYITGVQLEKGNIATSFDYRSISNELALCQRYYELIYAGQGAVGAASSTVCFISGQFLVTKRAAPTMAGGSSIQVRMYASGTGATSYTGGGVAATNQSSINGYEVQVGGFTGISQGFGQVQSLATPYSASAEL